MSPLPVRTIFFPYFSTPGPTGAFNQGGHVSLPGLPKDECQTECVPRKQQLCVFVCCVAVCEKAAAYTGRFNCWDCLEMDVQLSMYKQAAAMFVCVCSVNQNYR